MTGDKLTADREKLQREDAEFAARVGGKLRESVEELDGGMLSRLNRARQEALEHVDPSARGAQRIKNWLPAGGVAALAFVTVALWWGQTPGPDDDGSSLVAAEVLDFELLLDDGDPEMYEEFEFFVWLSEDELETIG